MAIEIFSEWLECNGSTLGRKGRVSGSRSRWWGTESAPLRDCEGSTIEEVNEVFDEPSATGVQSTERIDERP